MSRLLCHVYCINDLMCISLWKKNVQLSLNEVWDIIKSKSCINCMNVSYKYLLTIFLNLDMEYNFWFKYYLLPLHLIIEK